MINLKGSCKDKVRSNKLDSTTVLLFVVEKRRLMTRCLVTFICIGEINTKLKLNCTSLIGFFFQFPNNKSFDRWVKFKMTEYFILMRQNSFFDR